MPERVIVNFADNHSAYLAWQQRLIESLEPFGVNILAWRDELPPGSPAHSQVPYAFKPFAFLDAERRGYTSILWCDSAVWARKNPAPLFEIMDQQGHCLFLNGYNCGQWCTDAALEKHSLTRDEAMRIPDFTGCCMGLNLKSERSREFLKRWHEAAIDGVSFIGDWKNDQKQCSSDPRCLGHRHDQVIGSIIAHQLKMPLTDCTGIFAYWNGGKIADSVVVVNGRG